MGRVQQAFPKPLPASNPLPAARLSSPSRKKRPRPQAAAALQVAQQRLPVHWRLAGAVRAARFPTKGKRAARNTWGTPHVLVGGVIRLFFNSDPGMGGPGMSFGTKGEKKLGNGPGRPDFWGVTRGGGSHARLDGGGPPSPQGLLKKLDKGGYVACLFDCPTTHSDGQMDNEDQIVEPAAS